MNPILHPLNLDTTLSLLSVLLDETLGRQCIDERNPSCGGWINSATGRDEHGSAASVLGALLTILWGHDHCQIPLPMPRIKLLHRARLAGEYLLRVQSQNGLIDLLSCNYNSSPDSGFAVQRLGVGMILAEQLPSPDNELLAVLQLARDFVLKSAKGLISGGFHTPNHRWMISSALALAGHFHPALDVAPTIQAYLAEGIDVDPDGAYTEHSTGVYDAVSNLSLLILAKFGYRSTVLPAVYRNLAYNLSMIHPDGTAETGLSHRQDFGSRPIPLDLGAAYLLYQSFEKETDFLGMTNHLWRQKDAPTTTELMYLIFALQELGGKAPDKEIDAPTEYTHFFPHNRFWRMRQGSFSVSAFAGNDRILNASSGKAYLSAMRISQSYFGVGQFIAEKIEPETDGVILTSSGERHAVHRPGYDYPLGKPVNDVYASREEREWRKLPPANTILTLNHQEKTIKLHYHTIENHPGVLAQIAFDFLPGGIWEYEGGAFQPLAGQVIFLHAGMGRMLYGQDGFEIGPGADHHRYWEMRDTTPTSKMVRVIVPLITPVDYHFTIRAL